VESRSIVTVIEAEDTRDRAVDLIGTADPVVIGKAERIEDRVKTDQADIAAIPMETVLTAVPAAETVVLSAIAILTAIVQYGTTARNVLKDKNGAKDINEAVRG
jgi:predicted DNA repair protein MutK